METHPRILLDTWTYCCDRLEHLCRTFPDSLLFPLRYRGAIDKPRNLAGASSSIHGVSKLNSKLFLSCKDSLKMVSWQKGCLVHKTSGWSKLLYRIASQLRNSCYGFSPGFLVFFHHPKTDIKWNSGFKPILAGKIQRAACVPASGPVSIVMCKWSEGENE